MDITRNLSNCIVRFELSQVTAELQVFTQDEYISITYDCDLLDEPRVKHFGDASVNHDNPSMSKAKDKVKPVLQVRTFIKNALASLRKYFAININVLHTLAEARAKSTVCANFEKKKRDALDTAAMGVWA